MQGKIDTSIPAPVYDVDGFETSKGTAEELHRLCRKYEGFPEDGGSTSAATSSERSRSNIASNLRDGGFDAVEPDNLDFSSIRKSVELFAKPWKPCESTGAPAGVVYWIPFRG